MSLILTDADNYSNIAKAIRDKTGTNDTYKPTEMANAIGDITTGAEIEINEHTMKISGATVSGTTATV